MCPPAPSDFDPIAEPNWRVGGLLVVWTLCRREVVRFLRQRNRVFGGLGQPIVFWLLFSEGFGDTPELGYEHFFPGTLVMILLFTAIFATISVIEDRREGFLQSVLVSPAPRWAMVLGKLTGGTLLAMLQGGVFLLLGLVTGTVVPGAVGLVGTVVLMAVVAFSLTAMGFSIAWRMDSIQGFHAIMSLLLLPMWLLSGAFFPGKAGIVGWIVTINPLTYGVDGLRRLLQFSSSAEVDGASLAVCWTISLAMAAAMFLLAWKTSQRRTTGDLL